jgi:hypothetical protein
VRAGSQPPGGRGEVTLLVSLILLVLFGLGITVAHIADELRKIRVALEKKPNVANRLTSPTQGDPHARPWHARPSDEPQPHNLPHEEEEK